VITGIWYSHFTMQHKAKKSLGQNFLQNKGIIDKIIDAADPVANDIILEIGPGQGSLTKSLLTFAGKVIAVEKDDNLERYLKDLFSQEIMDNKFDLIHGDILQFEPELLRFYGSYKLVANIPYNITGAIIEKFLSASFQPTMMVLMVQKEVADRIVAKDKKTGNTGKGSILSNAIRAYGNPEYICTVKSGSFIPAPKIDSAVIRISEISRSHFISKHHEEVFFQVLKAGFAHKRKTLSGNLKNILEPELVTQALTVSNLAHQIRAEDLTIGDWLSLARIVYNDQYESTDSVLL
jgi:16S rRNA (adenine1518-N6/adenine1519-N6)-dimethyltransferase